MKLFSIASFEDTIIFGQKTFAPNYCRNISPLRWCRYKDNFELKPLITFDLQDNKKTTLIYTLNCIPPMCIEPKRRSTCRMKTKRANNYIEKKVENSDCKSYYQKIRLPE